MAPPAQLTDLPVYRELHALAEPLQSASIARMLEQDPHRAQEFTLQAAGLELDYSRQLLTGEVRSALWQLAEQANVTAQRARLFSGENVNNTEQRPALHTLLRADSGGRLQDKFRQVVTARERMRAICTALDSGQHRGFTGEAITDVVNIGIGGSDLGPRLVSEALRPMAPANRPVRCHYVANIDPADLQSTLTGLNPATTLFILCSKSFTTEETLCNGHAARDWLLSSGADIPDIDQHFLAVTANPAAAVQFGLSADHCLPVWDWVGGRYSVWSAIGLSSAIAIGWPAFEEFLAGARQMDHHFRDSALPVNMPLMMSLLEVWNSNILGAGNHAVLPYDHRLRRLPDFLQQLTMESNGKSVTTQGRPLDYASAPVLWGAAGTMGQHSFHQLLHQGTRRCPADFILPLTGPPVTTDQHDRLVAHCLAQSRAMMIGQSLEQARSSLLQRGITDARADELAPHLTMPGNRPHSVITLRALTPHTFGALLALYEHRTFCSAQLWGINPFDQWGVELGKQISREIFKQMHSDRDHASDPTTNRLVQQWRKARE